MLYYKWEQVVMVLKRQTLLFHVFQLITSLNAQERKENEKLTFTLPQNVKFNLIILAIILLIRTSLEQLRNYLTLT